MEEYACESRMHLNRREGDYIEKLDCVNKCIAGRTKKECGKYYYEKNKDKSPDYSKEYYKRYCDEIKTRTAESYRNNKEKAIENRRKYREQHKDKLRACACTKFDCPCGGQ